MGMTADLRDHSFSDLAAAIMGILDKHRGEKGLTLLLPPGRFSLVSETAFSSPSIAHDDGSGEDISKTRASISLKHCIEHNKQEAISREDYE